MSAENPTDSILDSPRTVGEVITHGVQTLRGCLKPVMTLMLPMSAIDLMLREGASTLMASTRETANAIEQRPEEALSLLVDMLVPFASGMALLVLTWLIVIAMQACAAVFAADAAVGVQRLPAEVLKHALKLWPRIMLAKLILFFAIMFLVTVLSSVAAFSFVVLGSSAAGIVVVVSVMVVLLAAVITLALSWALTTQMIVIEGRGVIEAMGRSASAMGSSGARFLRGPKARLSIVLLVYFFIAMVVQSAFLLPLGIVGFVEGIPLEEFPPPLAHVPLWVGIPVAVVEVLANSGLYPLEAFLSTVFYYDLKVRYGHVAEAPESMVGDDA